MNRPSWCLVFAVCSATVSFGQGKHDTVKLDVEGLPRVAHIFAPKSATKTSAPLLFAFHGHGWSLKETEENFRYHELWPQAIVVYPLGRPIPSTTDPKGKENGWQHEPEEVVEKVTDRDIKFFDALLKKVKADYKVDEKQIFATGHSNGGGFTYLLWATRGDTFAAVAPSSASSANKYFKKLTPKPVIHVAGEKDTTADFDNQRKLLDKIHKLNGVDAKGKKSGKLVTEFASSTGTPLVEVIHPGQHKFLEAAPPIVVQFLKDHPKK